MCSCSDSLLVTFGAFLSAAHWRSAKISSGDSLLFSEKPLVLVVFERNFLWLWDSRTRVVTVTWYRAPLQWLECFSGRRGRLEGIINVQKVWGHGTLWLRSQDSVHSFTTTQIFMDKMTMRVCQDFQCTHWWFFYMENANLTAYLSLCHCGYGQTRLYPL